MRSTSVHEDRCPVADCPMQGQTGETESPSSRPAWRRRGWGCPTCHLPDLPQRPLPSALLYRMIDLSWPFPASAGTRVINYEPFNPRQLQKVEGRGRQCPQSLGPGGPPSYPRRGDCSPQGCLIKLHLTRCFSRLESLSFLVVPVS